MKAINYNSHSSEIKTTANIYLVELIAVWTLLFSVVLLFRRDTWIAFCWAQLIALITVVVVRFLQDRRLSLYIMWVAGYIFIVWSEIVIISATRSSFQDYFTPILRFTLANFVVLASYNLHRAGCRIKRQYVIDTKKQKQIVFILILVFSIFAIIHRLPGAINGYVYGRSLGAATKSSVDIGKTFAKMLCAAMPAIIAWYYKKYTDNPWRSLWLAIPVMAISVFSTTRFRMLYAVLPYLVIMGVIPVKNIKARQVIIILSVVFVAVVFSSFLKRVRNLSIEEREGMALVENVYENRGGLPRVAGYMSPEGVVKMAYYADDYFKERSLHWGKEFGFAFYFWIPRAIWKGKPTQLDYWLIREYLDVSNKFSTASGFIGELRADFGWGLLLFMIFFGILLKEGDRYVVNVIEGSSIHTVVAACLYPFVFFMVRSPLTSFFQLINILIIVFIFSRFLGKYSTTRG